MTTLHLQISLDDINKWKTIDQSEMPLASVKRQKWATFARILTMLGPMLRTALGLIKMDSLPNDCLEN